MTQRSSVVVRATHVVAAVRADQLAPMAGEAMAASGAYLAVVINACLSAGIGGPRLFGRSRRDGFRGSCRGIGGEVAIEGAWPLRVHARQIKAFLLLLYTESTPFKLRFLEKTSRRTGMRGLHLKEKCLSIEAGPLPLGEFGRHTMAPLPGPNGLPLERRSRRSIAIIAGFLYPQGGIMPSKATAVWRGSLKEGKGTISTATGVLHDADYSFATRFEGADTADTGTTPEELIAAAHAACYSMALSALLGAAGLAPYSIQTHAAVTMAKVDAGFAITRIALSTTANVPGATNEVFQQAAADAKDGCPVSKLFANNTEITLEARLM